MRYGRHSVEDYDEEHPHDDRVAQARQEVAKLDQQKWSQEPDELPIDFKHRVEQSYDQIAEPYKSADLDRAEREAVRDFWIRDRAEDLSARRASENAGQSDERLKIGGQVAARSEVEHFKHDAQEGKNLALNAVISDLAEQQAARQEHITNDIAGPARDAKLKKLRLDQVKEPERQPEPEPQPEPVQSERPANAQHILEDVMEKAAEAKPAPEVSDDRLARLRGARDRIEKPPPALDEHSRTNANKLER